MTQMSSSKPPPIRPSDILSVLAYLRPRAFSGSKVRVGGPHDGGYVLPCAAALCDAVVSIGVGNDVSFDHEFADFGRLVLQFDHTLAHPPKPHQNCLFEPRGWGLKSEGLLISLTDMVGVLRGVGAVKPVLKFDVEGAEYELLLSLPPDLLQVFPVIVCELHDLRRLSDRTFYERVHAALQILTTHHVPVHLHANNYRDLVLIGGVPVPDVLEVSFLRSDVGVLDSYQVEPIPGPLDSPNDPSKFDFHLNALGSLTEAAIVRSIA